jgi:hypothetical protein
MKTATKVARVSATGRIRRTTAWKQSTDSRIRQLCSALGIDSESYKMQSLYRTYQRASALGITL